MPVNPFSSPFQTQTYGAGMYPQINYTPTPSLRNVIPGIAVNSIDDVYPSDVPTDGSMAIFPKKDGSCIYVKYWTADGKLVTKTFLPQDEEGESINPFTKTDDDQGVNIVDLINMMNDMSNDIKSLLSKQNKNTNYRNKQNKQNNQNGSDSDMKEHNND